MNGIPQNDAAAEALLTFIQKSPSQFHAVASLKDELEAAGFIPLSERQRWKLVPGGKYCVIRNGSSIISFVLPPKQDYDGFLIAASHSDSPTFKIKELPEIAPENGCIRLNIEKYGGMLCAPWFDRPLSVAGRVVCRSAPTADSIITERLVAVNRDLLMIPNLAIHFNRTANSNASYTVQNDMLPVFSCCTETQSTHNFMQIVADAAGVAPEAILSHDLFLYNRMPGTFWGAQNEYIASARLGDLECAFTTLRGFLSAQNDSHVLVHAVFDNEEVGSGTKQGADSTFLADTLERISLACGKNREAFFTALAKSFMVSADNAHAVHPNYSAVSDPTHRPLINGGPVIKFNASQKYTTDGMSAAVFKLACETAGVPYQLFTNRADIAGGSTLGNISSAHVSIPTVDVGIAQWAMHSPYESAGAHDPALMIRAMTAFYCTDTITR
ncbi:MAG: M18 family aminopeptidase [Treponema sp.]|nr:M18 family aminopeptidase [Treponema sp.]